MLIINKYVIVEIILPELPRIIFVCELVKN